MPPGNQPNPDPRQREAAGRLLREARRRRELTLIQVARRANYANHQTVHYWERNGPPQRDRTRLLWITRAYQLHRSEANYLLAWCGYADGLSDREWEEYGDPPRNVQPLSFPSDADVAAGPGAPSGPTRPIVPTTATAVAGGEPLAERRQVTVLRCYLTGASDLADRLSPGDFQGAVEAFVQACTAAVGNLDGRVVARRGAELVAAFGLPAAHEDDARRAVRAGLLVLAEVDRLNRKLEAEHGVRLSAGVTANTRYGVLGAMAAGDGQAEPVLAEDEEDAPGLRVAVQAGGLVISESTHRLVEGFFRCQRLDRAEPPDRPGTPSTGLYQVLGESGARGRVGAAAITGRLSPLVGREEQVQDLSAAWERSRQGQGRIALLGGEPGIGKSRLAQVFREEVTDGSGLVLEGWCQELYQQSPLHPIIELLEGWLGITGGQTPEEKLARLEGALTSLGPEHRQALPLLAMLLSLPAPVEDSLRLLAPSVLRRRTLEAVAQLVLGLGEGGPVLFLLEDLHWADASTLDLLGLLVEHSVTAPLLALLTFRPELPPPPWLFREHVSMMMLEPLSREDEESLVRHLLGGHSLPEEAHRELLSRTAGVPLYVEELVRLTLESSPDGIANRRGQSSETIIPAALQGGLTARMDRMPGGRAVAQLGAAIGPSFSYRLLQAASTLGEEATRRALGALVESGLMRQRGLLPEASFAFKHALIRDQAYQSLTSRSRRECHRRIAQSLRLDFPELAEAQPEILAHHYTEAGLGREAIPYWQTAGEQAVQRWAIVEAISHLNRGLDLLGALPDSPENRERELGLLMSLAPALMATRGFGAPETVEAYRRILELCRQGQEGLQLFPALWGVYIFNFMRGDLIASTEVADQLVRLAERSGQADHRITAYFAKGDLLLTIGDLAAGRNLLERAENLIDTWQPSWILLYGNDLRTFILYRLAFALWSSGYPNRSVDRCYQALKVAEESNHPLSIAFASSSIGYMHKILRENSETLRCANLAIQVSEANELPVWLACGIFLKGWVQSQTGEVQYGIRNMLDSIRIWEIAGAQRIVLDVLMFLGEAYGITGDVYQGLGLLNDVLEQFSVLGVPHYYLEPEALLIKGDLLIKQDSSEAEAQNCFQKAIAIASSQGARMSELRATTRLCRLLQQQGKTVEARELLAQIYGWFTEGFDTLDLIEAKQLLEELV